MRPDVLAALTAADLRARYGRGVGRLVKWLVDPFALVGVYLLLVTVVLDREGEATGLVLACAVVPFQLLTLAVINGMSAVALRRPIVLNMSFERALIPLATVCTESVAFAASLLLPALLMAVYGIGPTLALLWLPLVLAITLLLAVALSYAAALFGLYWPDLRTLGISLMRTLFFLSPGLIALSEIPDDAADIVRLNPLSGIFEAWRQVLIAGESPEAWMLLIPLAAAALILALVAPLWRRDQPHFAKVLG